LCDALGACAELNPPYRRLVKMALEDLQLIEQQIGQLDQEIASLLRQHQDAVERLAEVPGLGADSAQQIIAEVGAEAATFVSAKNLSSWVGAGPGEEESTGVNRSRRSPKGNRQMRRILTTVIRVLAIPLLMSAASRRVSTQYSRRNSDRIDASAASGAVSLRNSTVR
jgi:transposase